MSERNTSVFFVCLFASGYNEIKDSSLPGLETHQPNQILSALNKIVKFSTIEELHPIIILHFNS